MLPLHVYIDIDDVLAETTRALAELARDRFAKRAVFEEMHSFDLGESLGLSDEELPRFMEAAHEPDFLAGLTPVPGARETVSQWHASGAEISLVTGRPPTSHSATLRWIERAHIPHHRLEMVDKYGRHAGGQVIRREVLLERDYEIVIEDSAEMADYLARRSGARVLLFDRPWNRQAEGLHPEIRRVSSWIEIAALIDAAGDGPG